MEEESGRGGATAEPSQAAKRDRATYIGSHDIGAICGVDGAYDTEQVVYARKVGELGPTIPTPPMRWGLKLEPLIIADYSFAYPTAAKIVQYPVETRFHPQFPMLGSTPEAVDADGNVIDAKAVGPLESANKWGQEGTDEFPHNLIVQMAWHCAMFGAPKCWVLALFPVNGWTYKRMVYNRDLELEEMLLKIGSNWWERHVERRVPPPIGATDGKLVNEILRARYPGRKKGASRLPLADEIELARRVAAARLAAKRAKADDEHYSSLLKERFGEKAEIVGVGTYDGSALRIAKEITSE